jgi:hypothetical protein
MRRELFSPIVHYAKIKNVKAPFSAILQRHLFSTEITMQITNRRIFPFLLGCAGLLLTLSVARAGSLDSFPPEAKEELAYATGVQAFIYSYPLIHVNLFRHMFHNKSAPSYRGPANQLNHRRQLQSSKEATAASPNNDTLYTLAFVDLSSQPLVIETPEMGDRYYTIQLADFYAANFGDIGTRHNAGKPGKYLVVGPNWQGSPGPGVTEVYRSPTPWAMILLRVLVDNKKELEVVHVLQDSFKFKTIDGKAMAPFDSAMLPGIPDARNPTELWAVINRELTANPPPASDRSLVEQFAIVGIGPGQSEDISKLDPAVQKGLMRAAATGMQIVSAAAKDIAWGKNYNHWGYTKPDIGRYGADYLYRAGVTRMGLMANDPVEASYLSAYTGADGNTLRGGKSYRIRFSADNFPPAKAFWSITMYNLDNFTLVDNPIGRYSIGDRTAGLQYGDDGSLLINLSNAMPDKDLKSNWLPAPAGDFYLIMRVYLPEDSVVQQQWRPPAVEAAP